MNTAKIAVAATAVYIARGIYNWINTKPTQPELSTTELERVKELVALPIPPAPPIGWGTWFKNKAVWVGDTTSWMAGGITYTVLPAFVVGALKPSFNQLVKEHVVVPTKSSWIYQDSAMGTAHTAVKTETIKIKRDFVPFADNLQRLKNNLDLLATCPTNTTTDKDRCTDTISQILDNIEKTIGFINFSIKKLIPADAHQERAIAQNTAARITQATEHLCTTLRTMYAQQQWNQLALTAAAHKFSQELTIDIRLLLTLASYKMS